MKGLAATVNTLLTEIKGGNWSKYAGTLQNLGMVSGDDPTANYVQLGTTQYDDNFTEDDYKAMVADIYDGKIKIDNNSDVDLSAYEGTVAVSFEGNIK